MNRFNRKFNAKRKSMERWHMIVIKLSEFEGLINNYDGESSVGIRTLKAIHMDSESHSHMAI